MMVLLMSVSECSVCPVLSLLLLCYTKPAPTLKLMDCPFKEEGWEAD